MKINAKVDVTFKLRITTGDASSLFRALRETSEGFWRQARDSAGLTHDDDPGSDRQVSIEVGTLADLHTLLDLVSQQKHISGLVLFASVESDDGIRTWASLGRDWLDKRDGVRGSVFIDTSRYASGLDRAIREAIRVLREAMRGAA